MWQLAVKYRQRSTAGQILPSDIAEALSSRFLTVNARSDTERHQFHCQRWAEMGGGGRVTHPYNTPPFTCSHTLSPTDLDLSSICIFAVQHSQDGAALPLHSSPRTSRFLRLFHLSSCLPLVFQPNCQIPWAKVGCLDSLVRVLLRCCPARSLHMEDCRVT